MLRLLLFLSLVIHATSAQQARVPNQPPPPTKKWLTLNGQAPSVVARGGFSGLFPESSDFANHIALQTSLPDLILLCNLQLTKDGVGICQPEVTLGNTTNIEAVYPNQTKTYKVNGNDVTGYFAFDYTADQLLPNVSLVQNVFTRPSSFDGQVPISLVDDVKNAHSLGFWLNVQYDMVYTEHKLSVASYVQTTLRGVTHISSPEIGFLKTIGRRVNRARTKLFFVFLNKNATEPTTKQTYGSMLENLAAIKPFVSGIVVPNYYIWPLNADGYLEAPTTLVADAHKQGLEVYASGFANDYRSSYNYSYDPTAEYLQFIDNSQFSVDGLITDFPTTASGAVACFAAFNATTPAKGKPLIITHNGASGVYAGCTDLAYQQAVDDGADVIDCSVQMSKDGVAFCSNSADLSGETTATATFMAQSTTIPELQTEAGIFSFDLTWSEIQTLQPQLTSPYGASGLPRNPANKSKGKFVTLAEFLEFAKAKAVSGVLINIENAAYLASKKGLDIISAVNTAMSNATFDKQSTQQVLIQSDDTSVLSKFQGVPTYKRVLVLKNDIGDAPKQPVEEIKKYADTVMLRRNSITPTSDGFALSTTKVVQELQNASLSVFVQVLRNEFISLAFDYYADPTIEIATYTTGLHLNGVMTEYPATASRFFRNPCSDPTANLQYAILPIEAGSLVNILLNPLQARAPSPSLTPAEVIDPPLPAVAKITTTTPEASAPTTRSSDGVARLANTGLSSLVAIVLLSLLSMGY
ncbi:hypothetical protein K2173_021185 [Erythroxylum novogranatense]|uniref:glycerophosphodiester phosphodiesterase n=1 Tax=Erythroxylum novogranatense TaxID=1862640 RepID=A0AAV8TPS0_9ROSI|nr:hypothetical protein K2173_021185 [Erythroxylum novogranatense]